MSSNTVIIHMSTEEITKFTSFLTSKIDSLKRKVLGITSEHKILMMCRTDPPVKLPEDYLKRLDEKASEWLVRINDINLHITKFETLLKYIKDKAVFNIQEQQFKTLFPALNELQENERQITRVEDKYKYYPRLKVAKEQSLHVFSNKIKTLMGCKYVKIA
jgi:hypothetical protein